RTHNQFAHDKAGADRFAEADIVGQQRDGETAAERDEIANLMPIRREAFPPTGRRLKVRGAFDDDRVRQIPFGASAIDGIRAWPSVAAKNLGLKPSGGWHGASRI